jgi:hypothetical protein
MQLGEENRIISSTIELQDVIYWTFWKVRPPRKRKKELRTVRGPEALEHRSLTKETLGTTVLRREQREQLENNHHKD